MRWPFPLLLSLVVLGGLVWGASPPAPKDIPRGLVLQEGGVDAAAALGVTMAAKRWPASGGIGPIDAELAKAQVAGVKLIVGWMWDNEGTVDATPADWLRVCWGTGASGCGPNWADPGVRAKALQSIRDLGARYDGHPQIAAVMANVGLDGERRFCKRPVDGDPCWEAYRAAGLTRSLWQNFVADVIRTYAEAFPRTPVLFHYSGFGFQASEVGRDADVAVQAGLGLLSSSLYPAQCSGNSWGGQCNPLTPLMNDWQVPSLYPGHPLAMEQSLAYGPDQAALAWEWAVTHGAWQIHAQRATLEASGGTEWREMAEYHLARPEAAIWVAWEPTQALCSTLGRPFYCPEVGNWSRNVTEAQYGAAVFGAGPGYLGWVARQGPVTLRTTVAGRAEVRVWRADGTKEVWMQNTGSTVQVAGLVHRVEVRPLPEETPTATPVATATPTWTPTATPPPTWTPTTTPMPAWTPTPEPPETPTPTPWPMGSCWRVQGKIGPLPVDLEICPITK